MLTFTNSKLPDDWPVSDKQNHILQKTKSYEISNTNTYILPRTWNLLFMYFTEIHVFQTIKSILNVKKHHLIKFISKCNIYCRIKSPQQKKHICHSVPKTFDFSQNSSVPFHQVTFHHSISSVPLIDKPNQSSKTPKKVKEMPYPLQKAILHQQRQMPQFNKILQEIILRGNIKSIHTNYC